MVVGVGTYVANPNRYGIPCRVDTGSRKLPRQSWKPRFVSGITDSSNSSTKWDQAYECFRDDVSRCHQLGVKLYNWQWVRTFCWH